MRPIALAAIVCVAGAITHAAEPPLSRVDLLEQWITAVAHHAPGSDDAAARTAASWTTEQLRTLRTDLNALVLLMRDQRAKSFGLVAPGTKSAEAVWYTATELDRLRLLARIAAGSRRIEPDAGVRLQEAASRLRASKLGGEDNSVLKRGALLRSLQRDRALVHRRTRGVRPVVASS